MYKISLFAYIYKYTGCSKKNRLIALVLFIAIDL